MDPEVSAILAVYQKRLNDVTQQAIAYEARIQVLQLQEDPHFLIMDLKVGFMGIE